MRFRNTVENSGFTQKNQLVRRLFRRVAKSHFMKFSVSISTLRLLRLCERLLSRVPRLMARLVVASLFILGLLMPLDGCELPSSADDPGLVSNLRFSPSAFDSFKSYAEIRYTLKLPAQVSIYILTRDSDGSEFLVKTLAQNVDETKGSHSHTWLGDSNQGHFAPTGTYIGVVEIRQRQFETTVLIFHF